MKLVEKILTIYPELIGEPNIFNNYIIVADNADGSSPFIAKWDHPVYPKPTFAQLEALENAPYDPIFTVKRCNEIIQKHLDQVAQSKKYDNAASIVSYIGNSNAQWDAEARAFQEWRTQIWTSMIDILNSIENGTLINPSIQYVLNQLPEIEWD